MSISSTTAALPAALCTTSGTLVVLPWPDPVVESVGHDPRSPYVERFWLGILGPSTTWFLRHTAERFEREPDGFELDVVETAGALGLAGKVGRDGAFTRSLARSVTFGMASPHSHGLSVRTKLPPLSQRHLMRLPARLQDTHRQWVEGEVALASGGERQRQRARTLALSLATLGDHPDEVADQLYAWRFPPAVVHEAIGWVTGQDLGTGRLPAA